MPTELTAMTIETEQRYTIVDKSPRTERQFTLQDDEVVISQSSMQKLKKNQVLNYNEH